MSAIKDLTGKRFGNLTVIEKYNGEKRNKTTNSSWVCVCDCGNKKIVTGSDLKNGHTKSCGCLAKEMLICRNLKHGLPHGRLYNIWKNMRQRCSNNNKDHYDRYGGRGISVCDQWNEYSNFFEWANKNGYKDSLTIDRIDTQKNYCPENCRWADWKIQQNNRSSNHVVTIEGEQRTLKEWSKISGINYRTIQSRIKNGWDEELAIKSPVNRKE